MEEERERNPSQEEDPVILLKINQTSPSANADHVATASASESIKKIDFSDIQSNEETPQIHSNEPEKDLPDEAPNPAKRRKIDEDADGEELYGEMQLRSQLMHCVLRFPSVTRTVLKDQFNITTAKGIDEMTVSQLSLCIKYIRMTLGGRSIGIITDFAKETLLTGLQAGGAACGLELDGFKAECITDEEFNIIADEWSLDMINTFYMHPKWRMGMYIVSKLFKVHSENKGTRLAREKMNAARDAPKPPEPQRSGVKRKSPEPPSVPQGTPKAPRTDDSENEESDVDYDSEDLSESNG